MYHHAPVDHLDKAGGGETRWGRGRGVETEKIKYKKRKEDFHCLGEIRETKRIKLDRVQQGNPCLWSLGIVGNHVTRAGEEIEEKTEKMHYPLARRGGGISYRLGAAV